MFDLLTKREWAYSGIAFIVGIIMLYNFNVNSTISLYIMAPIDVIGVISMMMFFRELSINGIRYPNEVKHE